MIRIIGQFKYIGFIFLCLVLIQTASTHQYLHHRCRYTKQSKPNMDIIRKVNSALRVLRAKVQATHRAQANKIRLNEFNVSYGEIFHEYVRILSDEETLAFLDTLDFLQLREEDVALQLDSLSVLLDSLILALPDSLVSAPYNESIRSAPILTSLDKPESACDHKSMPLYLVKHNNACNLYPSLKQKKSDELLLERLAMVSKAERDVKLLKLKKGIYLFVVLAFAVLELILILIFIFNHKSKDSLLTE